LRLGLTAPRWRPSRIAGLDHPPRSAEGAGGLAFTPVGPRSVAPSALRASPTAASERRRHSALGKRARICPFPPPRTRPRPPERLGLTAPRQRPPRRAGLSRPGRLAFAPVGPQIHRAIALARAPGHASGSICLGRHGRTSRRDLGARRIILSRSRPHLLVLKAIGNSQSLSKALSQVSIATHACTQV